MFFTATRVRTAATLSVICVLAPACGWCELPDVGRFEPDALLLTEQAPSTGSWKKLPKDQMDFDFEVPNGFEVYARPTIFRATDIPPDCCIGFRTEQELTEPYWRRVDEDGLPWYPATMHGDERWKGGCDIPPFAFFVETFTAARADWPTLARDYDFYESIAGDSLGMVFAMADGKDPGDYYRRVSDGDVPRLFWYQRLEVQ